MAAGFDRLSHHGSFLNSSLIPLICVSMAPIVPKPHEISLPVQNPPITIVSDPQSKADEFVAA
jgi:hypothetical protein